MEKVILNNLDPSEYEHPMDKKALDALKATPGLPSLIKFIRKYSYDKIQKIIYTGSYLKIGPRQFPHVYEMFMEACRILDIAKPPKLYVTHAYEINAFANCFADPMIVIHSGCIETLTDGELMQIIGHELGHVHCQHILYNDLANVFAQFGTVLGDMTLGIGGLLSKGLEVALLYWARMSEFSCDRAGLLVTQDFSVVRTTYTKMAGTSEKYPINPDAFMEQAREFKDYDLDTLDKMAKIFSVMYNTHPWTVMRAGELERWYNSGEYDAVLKRQTRKQTLPVYKNSFVCPACGTPVQPDDSFCPNCGQKLN